MGRSVKKGPFVQEALAKKVDAERPVLLVSGGNVAANTAAAILAGR